MSRLSLSLLLLMGTAAAVPSLASLEAAPPVASIAEGPEPLGIIRQRRAAAEPPQPPPVAAEKLINPGKKAINNPEKKTSTPLSGTKDPVPPPIPPPSEIRLPSDVEIVPGFSAPPVFDEPDEDEKDVTTLPTPLPTVAGVPPPAEGEDIDDEDEKHINYEGLYYTTFAENNTHQEIRTPLAELATASHSCRVVRSVPTSVRRQLGLSTFYQRYTEAYGIPVLSSSRVPDAALRRACYIVRFLFADIRAARDSYRRRRGRVAVIGRSERTTQIPEHSSLGPAWDSRARGLGATDAAPVCTIGEENLLAYGYPADRWYSEDIGLHEFAHGFHLLGARYAMPNWERRLEAAYNSARSRSLWTNTYAATNHIEYFAEGVQKYHNVEAYSQYPNGIHNHVDTRDKLRQYDPTLYQLVAEIFPCGNRYISRRESGFQAASDAAQLKLEYPACLLEGSTGTNPERPATTARPAAKTTPRFRETPTTTRPTAAPTKAACSDNNGYCASWASAGYCYSNAGYMTVNCRRSCRVCGSCVDTGAHCGDWSRKGECARNPGYMLHHCRRSCRVC